MFYTLQLEKIQVSETEAKNHNAGFCNNIQPHKKRNMFFKLMHKDMKVSQAVEKCLAISFWRCLILKMKYLIKEVL